MLVMISLDEFSFVLSIEMLPYPLPACIGSLNVTVIIFVGDAMVLFAGSVLVMVGCVVLVVLVIVKLDVNVFVKLSPERSVMLFAGIFIAYSTPCVQLFGDVMVNVFPDMVVVMV